MQLNQNGFNQQQKVQNSLDKAHINMIKMKTP